MPVVPALTLVYGLGVIFAIMLVALFIGGFVRGNLFPDFLGITSWRDLNFRLAEWSKLVVWSFIVGFSERLMPNIFDQLTERFYKASEGEAPRKPELDSDGSDRP